MEILMIEFIFYWYVIGVIIATVFRGAQAITRLDGRYSNDLVSFIMDATIWPVAAYMTYRMFKE
jgi:hypothetical protein